MRKYVGIGLIVTGVVVAGLGPLAAIRYAKSLTPAQLSEQWMGLGILEIGSIPIGLLIAGIGIGASLFGSTKR